MDKRYYVYTGPGERAHFSIPGGWVVTHFAEHGGSERRPPVAALTLDALTRPMGTFPLSEMVAGKKKIAILVDDLTRPTPVAEVLGTLLPHLEAQGIARESVTLVVAAGTHEPMKPHELEGRVGKDVAARYRVVQHDAWQADLVPFQLSDGRVVKINPFVAEADLKVGVSSVLPHPKAGFGGGPKVVMPGVSDFEFIRDHHMTRIMGNRWKLGITQGNRFHDGCLEVARRVGLDFTINCVYNQQGELTGMVGGSLEAAFPEAAARTTRQCGQRFEEKVDITITSTFPHLHGQQILKGTSAPDIVTKETGAILLVAPLVAPVPAPFLASFDEIRERSGNDPSAYVKESLSKGMAFLPDKSIDFNMAISTAFLRPPIRTLLVSPVITEEQARVMGLGYAPSIESALQGLGARYRNAKVAIFPAGGLIVPLTGWAR